MCAICAQCAQFRTSRDWLDICGWIYDPLPPRRLALALRIWQSYQAPKTWRPSMPLANVAGIDRSLTVANEMLGQVRDVGGCLEHLLATYDRLVRGLLSTDVPIPDSHDRLRAISSQIEDVSKRVQEMLILVGEDQHLLHTLAD